MPSNNGTQQALRDLKVLAEIERNPRVSQRTISKRVGIALGLTNSILRRLVRKGLVTTRAIAANRFVYHLTPEGLADKTCLFIDYVRTTTNFFCIVRNRMVERLEALVCERGIRTVAIVGVNELSDAAYLATRELGLELVGVYDAARAGASWLGLDVQAPGETVEADAIVFVDIEESSPQAWRPARPEAVVVRMSEVLAADLMRFARGFE